MELSRILALSAAVEHGWRVGCVVDPFDHEWEIGKPVVPWPLQ